VKTNKNDMADAEGIGEALSRPTMRFVSTKSQFQQDIQSIHRIRQLLVKHRTALCNEIRGVLHEYGIIISKGIDAMRKALVIILEEERGNKLSELICIELSECYNRLVSIDSRIKELEQRLWDICKSIDTVKMLLGIPGVGKLTASAMIAKVGDMSIYKNARQFSAWLGLVPKHEATGGKAKIMGISKRGDKYLRALLIHGARSALNYCPGKNDRLSVWATQVIERRGRNKAIVALANKNARIMYSLLTKGEDYKTYPIRTAEAV
jgi:transposase